VTSAGDRPSPVYLVCLVYLVHLVSLVYLVCFVYFVGLVQPNKQDKPNKPNEQERLADFFSSLVEDRRRGQGGVRKRLRS